MLDSGGFAPGPSGSPLRQHPNSNINFRN